MDGNSDTRMTTPFRWKQCILSLVVWLLLVLIVVHRNSIEHYYRPGDGTRGLAVLLGVVTVMFGFHHTITKKHLIVRFCGIPIRFIPWSQVNHAVYIHTWNDGGKSDVHGHCVVVTLLGCPRFVPLHNGRLRFRIEHPIGCLLVRLPDAQTDEYLSLFRSCYPNLEFQSNG